ncbi:MAG: hypothetical protein C5B52_03975 [Bacteroidetes bacterium]|nr:MAG: hypothetical protein C5B52_03975 [Bacteroidota bacterium]
MKKPILGIIFFLVIQLNVQAQSGLDSLLRELNSATRDTAKIDLMIKIARKYVESKPDLTFKYCTDALTLSRKINYERGEALALSFIGVAFIGFGDFPKALENILEALKKSEAINDKHSMGVCYMGLGAVYGEQGDYQRALEYCLKSNKIYQDLNNVSSYTATLVNTGNAYLNLNRMDSARFYLNKAVELSRSIDDKANEAGAYLNLGYIHFKLNQFDLATAFYRQGIPTFISDNNYLFLYNSYYFLAQIYDSTHHYDSAFRYSRLALIFSQKMGSATNEAEIANQLSGIFKKKGELDSALFYMSMAMNAKDSMTSQEKIKKLQALTFSEQLRQMQIAEQVAKDAESRKRNLQLAAIAIFIPLFFLFVLILSKRKVKTRTVEFFAVLSLLFLFEFIVLFAHPFIGKWTHESPIWMLLILVIIASLLVPLHHRSEQWIKNKLTHKPKPVVPVENMEEPAQA